MKAKSTIKGRAVMGTMKPAFALKNISSSSKKTVKDVKKSVKEAKGKTGKNIAKKLVPKPTGSSFQRSMDLIENPRKPRIKAIQNQMVTERTRTLSRAKGIANRQKKK